MHLTRNATVDRQFIQRYRDGSFTVSGARHSGSVLVLPTTTVAWEARRVADIDSDALVATLPLFLYGVFRYLYLVYERGAGGSPEEIFLRDRALQIDALLYLAAVIAILALRY